MKKYAVALLLLIAGCDRLLRDDRCDTVKPISVTSVKFYEGDEVDVSFMVPVPGHGISVSVDDIKATALVITEGEKASVMVTIDAYHLQRLAATAAETSAKHKKIYDRLEGKK